MIEKICIDLQDMSKEIARVWELSKLDAVVYQHKDYERMMMLNMSKSLSMICGNNLLNIVIPGYESLYRCCVYCIVYIYSDLAVLKIIKKELQNNSVCSLKSITKHVLHYYPPVKSIYRDVTKVNVLEINRKTDNNLTFSCGPQKCPAASLYVPTYLQYFLKCFILRVEALKYEETLIKILSEVNLNELYSSNRIQLLDSQ